MKKNLEIVPVGVLSESMVYVNNKLICNSNLVNTQMPEQNAMEAAVHNEIKYFIPNNNRDEAHLMIFDSYNEEWVDYNDKYDEVYTISGSYDNATRSVTMNLQTTKEDQIDIYAYKYASAIEHPMTIKSIPNVQNYVVERDGKYELELADTYAPFNSGIYTAKFSTSHPVSKLRLTMRVNREGMYEAEETKDVMMGEPLNAIGVEADDLKAKGFKFSENRYVAIGTNFRKVRSVIGDSLYFDEGVHAEVGDPIYPINYDVTIKGFYNVWNPETCKIEEHDYVFAPMKLVAILPDKVHPAPMASDRLVYEAEFWNEEEEETSQVPSPRQFTDFEIQIHWEKSANELGSRVNAKIYSLNVSADRSF